MQFKQLVRVIAADAASCGMSLTIVPFLSGCTDLISSVSEAPIGKSEDSKNAANTFFGSDIPVSWIMDVIVVCLSIFVFVLFVKTVIWMIRTIDRHCCSNYKKVLKEAVSISDSLKTLYKNDSGNQSGDCLQRAYMSLGKIKAFRDCMSFCSHNKRRIDKIIVTLEKELPRCNLKDEEGVCKEQIGKAWQKVNEAIAEYLK